MISRFGIVSQEETEHTSNLKDRTHLCFIAAVRHDSLFRVSLRRTRYSENGGVGRVRAAGGPDSQVSAVHALSCII